MIAFTIFGFDIYWYGIFYLISFLIGYILLGFVIKNIKKRLFPKVYNLLTNKKDDLFIFIVLGVLIGGRLGHFLIYYPKDLFSNFYNFFSFHQGGMSFIGGIVGVLISLYIFFKKNKLTGKEIWQILDIITSLIPIGSLIGRWGNFLNQELYGIPFKESFFYDKISLSTINFLKEIKILHIYDKIDNILRINTNLLASLGEGLFVFIIVQIVFWKIYGKKGNNLNQMYGFVSIVWLFCYSFIRFFLEYIRQDSQLEFVGLFTKSQWFFLIFMFVCIVFMLFKIFLKKNIKN